LVVVGGNFWISPSVLMMTLFVDEQTTGAAAIAIKHNNASASPASFIEQEGCFYHMFINSTGIVINDADVGKGPFPK
jgi:hypothetical protein